MLSLFGLDLGINGDAPLRVFEPEPRFLYGDRNACGRWAFRQSLHILDERRRVKTLHCVDLGDFIEHSIAALVLVSIISPLILVIDGQHGLTAGQGHTGSTVLMTFVTSPLYCCGSSGI